MRTVLHAIDTAGPGGAETIFIELAQRLSDDRFCACTAVVREGWVNDTLIERGLDTTIVRPGNGSFDVGYTWRLMQLARRKRVRLIQSHLLAANLYCGFVARMLRIPAVATFHGMVDVAPNDRRARTKLRLIASNAARLVFVSEALRRHFQNLYGVAEERTVVIPNGIDIAQYQPRPHHELRAEFGIRDDEVLVGAVGNIRPAKAYDELLRVAAALKQSHPKIRFIVAGEPGEPLYQNLLAQRRELGVEDRVIFAGFRPDIESFLNGVDFCVSTSTSEGFSLTTVQAMACGRAVVATRSGGPEEIVTNGTDGILVPVRDTAAMTEIIVTLADDLGFRRRLGAAGRETAARRFSIATMVSAYETIYDAI